LQKEFAEGNQCQGMSRNQCQGDINMCQNLIFIVFLHVHIIASRGASKFGHIFQPSHSVPSLASTKERLLLMSFLCT
jgi:hypothetical protein